MADNKSGIIGVSCANCASGEENNPYHVQCNLITQAVQGKVIPILPEGFQGLHLGDGIVGYNSYCLKGNQRPYREDGVDFPVRTFKDMIAEI